MSPPALKLKEPEQADHTADFWFSEYQEKVMQNL
jgi:hypothetical protein